MEKGQTTWNHHLGSPLGLVCTPSSRQARRLPTKLNKFNFIDSPINLLVE